MPIVGMPVAPAAGDPMARIETPFRILLTGAALAVVGAGIYRAWVADAAPVTIGVLVSATERSGVVAAAELAASEISAAGGPHGRPIRIRAVETKGDPATAARSAERLVREEGVIALIVACTSEECRQVGRVAVHSGTPVLSVQPLMRLDESSDVFELAGGPNQRMIPAIAWALNALGSRAVFVGPESAITRVAEALVRDQLTASGATLLASLRTNAGEAPSAAGDASLDAAAERIAALRPTLILSTVEPDGAIALAQALRRRGLEPGNAPTLHLALTDDDVASLDALSLAGDYLITTCGAAATLPARIDFAKRVRAAAPTRSIGPLGERAEAAYAAARLAAAAAGRSDPGDRAAIAAALAGASVDGPSHPTSIDTIVPMAWVRCGIGRIESNGSIIEAWQDDSATRPQPWPLWRTRETWVALARGETNEAESAPQGDEVER